MPFSSLSGLNSTPELTRTYWSVAAVVVRVRTAVDTGVAFARGLTAAEVDRRAAVDNNAAPIAPASLPDRLVARKDDRRRGRADCVQPSPLSKMRVPTLPASPMIAYPRQRSVAPDRTKTAPRST